MTREEATAIMRRLEPRALDAPGATGVMLRAADEPPGFRIIVTVDGDPAAASAALPDVFEGLKVEVIARGAYRRHGEEEDD